MINGNVYKVTIEETVSQSFDVYADTSKDALQIAMEKYNNGEFVLEPGNLVNKQMCIEDTSTASHTEWMEF